MPRNPERDPLPDDLAAAIERQRNQGLSAGAMIRNGAPTVRYRPPPDTVTERLRRQEADLYQLDLFIELVAVEKDAWRAVGRWSRDESEKKMQEVLNLIKEREKILIGMSDKSRHTSEHAKLFNGLAHFIDKEETSE